MEGVLGLVIGMCLLAGLALAWWLTLPRAAEDELPAVPAAAARQTARLAVLVAAVLLAPGRVVTAWPAR